MPYDGPRPRRRRRYTSGGADDDDDGGGGVDRTVRTEQLLNQLNNTPTVADLILNDSAENKIQAMEAISRHSAIGKIILEAMKEDDDSLRLGTVNTINVLKLMSDIFDNKVIVTTNHQ
ncbi:P12 [Alphabaculovirus myunipunctae]|uniref:P12 n=1 Tax=Mythimna unipuncta nucleopolyhedrovirus TaxID=447897 RepID=A0A2K9VSC3_9ABAC|nr:P12 [Mythimna unipuncta nucleopolyhedrovirus]AUV65340.1 P12 [Mythimna unipuncta nucleopolyhedrovirus]